MRNAVLLDANVLVYAVDRLASEKHALARQLLRTLDSDSVVLSTQVLSEYANVSTHPNKLALDSGLVATSVLKLADGFTVVPVTPDTVVKALQARDRWQLSYYDAQIWAAAALTGVPVVLSEDFTDGLVLGPVRFVNPFAEGFDVSSLG